jgi:fructose-1,6-bisphosphatase/inositol monophosphatase family enzyme
MNVRQDSQASNKIRLPLQDKVLANNRFVSTIRTREKKKHRNLKQIFVLSLDDERKGSSALTMLMVVLGGALMVTINGMSAGLCSIYE